METPNYGIGQQQQSSGLDALSKGLNFAGGLQQIQANKTQQEIAEKQSKMADMTLESAAQDLKVHPDMLKAALAKANNEVGEVAARTEQAKASAFAQRQAGLTTQGERPGKIAEATGRGSQEMTRAEQFKMDLETNRGIQAFHDLAPLDQASPEVAEKEYPIVRNRIISRHPEMEQVLPEKYDNIAQGIIKQSGIIVPTNPELQKKQLDIAVEHEKQLVSAMKENEKANSTEYKKSIDDASSAAKDAQQLDNYIDQFNVAYNKATRTGSVLGGLESKGYTTVGQNVAADQDADIASQNMVASMLKLFKGRQTNMELRFLGNLKLNRTLEPEVVRTLSDILKSKNQRIGEEAEFLNAAKNKGLDSSDAKVLWNRYNAERPYYDFVGKKALKSNLHSYSDYLNKDALTAVRSGLPYSPKGTSTTTISVMLPNGETGDIPLTSLDRAVARGAKVIEKQLQD